MALAARLVPSTARRLARRLLSAPAVAPAETATNSIYNPTEEHAALRAHVEGAAQLERPAGLRSRAASAAQRWPRARRPPRPVAAITTPLLFHNQNDPHGRLLRPAVVITPTLWAVARRPLGVPRRLPADGCRPR